MSKRFVDRIGAAVLLAAFVAMEMAAASPAAAQYPTRYQEWQYETKHPQRGYEGFPAPGVYCSYQRIPNRVCTTDKSGRKKCRIKSWTLIQSCS